MLLTFGGIGGVFALSALYLLWSHQYQETLRIAAQLTRMLAGTLAALTAFTVVNVRLEPAFVLWLAPTVVLAPVTAYRNMRVRRPARSGAVPSRRTIGTA
ncbi:MAG TPA: hypothetical protein VGX03_25050 [Candidatus Binatia bacterium]|nr:hypothetical protein [Candidatus Binatia bacterium]